MQLESHATPFGGSPQQRYASLHRAIERGLDSDDVWCELARVCLQLGKRGEALHCLAGIRDGARHSRIASEIRRASRRTGQEPDEADGSPAPRRHSAAPAASHAGAENERAHRPKADELPGVADHLLDAAQYLLHQHMPWLVLTTVLAFPLVVGVGGLLTADSSPLLLTAIAALPGLCVLTVIAAMGHEILVHSSEGNGDVPEFPEFGRLVRGARDFTIDIGLIGLTFFAPPLLMLVAGASLPALLPGLIVSALLAPLAFALRHVRRDLRAISPVFLLRALRRSGRGYPLVALATTLSFAPAAVVAWAVTGHPVWMQIAVVGPLCVLPVFSASRLLGTWLDTHRKSLGYLLVGGTEPAPGRPAATSKVVGKPRQPRKLRRPESMSQFHAPKLTQTTRKAPPKAPPRPASALRRSRTTAGIRRAIEGRAPQTTRPPTTANKTTSAGERSREDPSTDLSKLPGAFIVSGAERESHGAASRRG